MLKSHWRFISRLARIGDNLLIVAAFLLSFKFRDQLVQALDASGLAVFDEATTLGEIEHYYIILAISLALFNAFLSLLGAYRSMRLATVWQLCKLSVVSSTLTFLSVGSILFMLKLDLSRSFVGLFCVTAGIFVFIERIFILRALRYFRRSGKNFRNILIVGTGEQAQNLSREISNQPELGVRIVGFAKLAPEEPGSIGFAVNSSINSTGAVQDSPQIVNLPVNVIANEHTFENVLKQYAIDEVIFTDIVKFYATVEELSAMAFEEGVRVTFAADLFSLALFRSDFSYFGNTPLIHYEPSAGCADSSQLIIKRLIDVGVSATALVVLSPLMLLIAALVRFDSIGPVFFKQRRVGLNGRIFTLLKFRSMVVNAEKLRSALESENEMKGPVFKIANDPRITKVGRLLRKYSLDELPQLINVLRGDMSLVGPRPPLPDEVKRYNRKQRKRLSMRPGLTCTWQVSGRNDIPDFEQWAILDLEYIDNWSLGRDFNLLLKTIPAVLSGKGAN